ncbi:hypothetical protein HDV00_010564 [Rhizophlyctis rosea]|nr:hypothetical protein HDV00_010564 [Rhizophlyctis rosea]
MDIEQLGVTYVCLEDSEVENTIEDKLAALTRLLDAPGSPNKTQLAVMFFERRPKKSWFSKSEEEVCWEQWLITLTTTTSKTEREQIEARKSLRENLVNALTTISQKTNEQKEHIPPITNNDPFPFQIVTLNTADVSWTSMLRQFVSTGGPSSLMPT